MPSHDRPVFDVQLIAFYLPQFHPIPENDVWWGKGFTEWANVRRAKPNFVGHYQPHVPTELGYYDLGDAKARDAQADLARAHGIHGFCYYYYWFNGRRLLHRPLDEVVQSGRPDFPFCVCWANENWTRRWDGGHDELLLAQTYSPENEQRLIADLVPLFRDRRYIRVNGRPLLLVYRANLLPEPRRATETFRSVARASGEREPDFPFFRGVMVGWDNTPRLQNSGQIFVNSHPENYSRWLSAMVAQTLQNKRPEERLVFLNAWNEWGEGCHLEPDAQFGRGYLEATRAVLAGEQCRT